jgi:hypothetical protein
MENITNRLLAELLTQRPSQATTRLELANLNTNEIPALVRPFPFDPTINDLISHHLWSKLMNAAPLREQDIYSDDKNMTLRPEMLNPGYSSPGGFVRDGLPGLSTDRFMRDVERAKPR